MTNVCARPSAGSAQSSTCGHRVHRRSHSRIWLVWSINGRNPTAQVNRALVNLNWRRKFTDPLGQVFTPYFSGRGDIISIKDTIDPTTRLLLDDRTVVRGTGTAGLTYSYPFVANTATASHVIEPIGQVLSTNTTSTFDQRRLPNLDSRSVIADDINLFEVDKLSGYDRIDTGIRTNYGLQYTLQANGQTLQYNDATGAVVCPDGSTANIGTRGSDCAELKAILEPASCPSGTCP